MVTDVGDLDRSTDQGPPTNLRDAISRSARRVVSNVSSTQAIAIREKIAVEAHETYGERLTSVRSEPSMPLHSLHARSVII
jgi:hypothetical protein